MKKTTLITYLFSLVAFICSSFKTDQIQPNNPAGKYLENSFPKNRVSTLISEYYTQNESETQGQFNKKQDTYLTRSYQIITEDTIIATGYQISATSYHPFGDGERVFYFPSLDGQSMPCYITVYVSDFNTGSETPTDSDFEYDPDDFPNGTLNYYHGGCNTWGPAQYDIYGAVQLITLPSSQVTWDVSFRCQSGTANITLVRMN